MAGRAGAFAILAAALLSAGLAGCGFRPLYGRAAADPRVNAELGSIYIPALPDREGQLVHNALLAEFDQTSESGGARYRLNVVVTEAETPTVLQSDQTASRAVVNFAATYTLFEGNVSLTSGNFKRVFSYDYVPEQYSNVSARGDVGRRAAREIAMEIRNRVATYFSEGAKARAAAAAAAGQAPPQQQ